MEAGSLTIAETINTNNEVVNAAIAVRSTTEQVNSSICHISSLEVYRGREQAIEINYTGFSISGSGTIEVSLLYVSKRITIKGFLLIDSHRPTSL